MHSSSPLAETKLVVVKANLSGDELFPNKPLLTSKIQTNILLSRLERVRVLGSAVGEVVKTVQVMLDTGQRWVVIAVSANGSPAG